MPSTPTLAGDWPPASHTPCYTGPLCCSAAELGGRPNFHPDMAPAASLPEDLAPLSPQLVSQAQCLLGSHPSASRAQRSPSLSPSHRSLWSCHDTSVAPTSSLLILQPSPRFPETTTHPFALTFDPKAWVSIPSAWDLCPVFLLCPFTVGPRFPGPSSLPSQPRPLSPASHKHSPWTDPETPETLSL